MALSILLTLKEGQNIEEVKRQGEYWFLESLNKEDLVYYCDGGERSGHIWYSQLFNTREEAEQISDHHLVFEPVQVKDVYTLKYKVELVIHTKNFMLHKHMRSMDVPSIQLAAFWVHNKEQRPNHFETELEAEVAFLVDAFYNAEDEYKIEYDTREEAEAALKDIKAELTHRLQNQIVEISRTAFT